MSDFRCPYYYWDGDFGCYACDSGRATSYEFDTYCSSETGCYRCPYFKR